MKCPYCSSSEIRKLNDGRFLCEICLNNFGKFELENLAKRGERNEKELHDLWNRIRDNNKCS